MSGVACATDGRGRGGAMPEYKLYYLDNLNHIASRADLHAPDHEPLSTRPQSARTGVRWNCGAAPRS